MPMGLSRRISWTKSQARGCRRFSDFSRRVYIGRVSVRVAADYTESARDQAMRRMGRGAEVRRAAGEPIRGAGEGGRGAHPTRPPILQLDPRRAPEGR